jgi:hypothetical protein
VLHFADGKQTAYDQVISSIPLPDLIPLIDGVPKDVVDSAGRLAFPGGANQPWRESIDPSDAAITYFYDEDDFSRVNLMHMFSDKRAAGLRLSRQRYTFRTSTGL